MLFRLIGIMKIVSILNFGVLRLQIVRLKVKILQLKGKEIRQDDSVLPFLKLVLYLIEV